MKRICYIALKPHFPNTELDIILPSSVILQCTIYKLRRVLHLETIYSKEISVTWKQRLKFKILRCWQLLTSALTTSSVSVEQRRRSNTLIFLQYCAMYTAVCEVIPQELSWSLSSDGQLCTISWTPSSPIKLSYSTESHLSIGQLRATEQRLSLVRERHWSIINFSNLVQLLPSWNEFYRN